MIPAGGDHFYVRAHINYEGSADGELNVNAGDILLVENSLLHGQIGKWHVWKIDQYDRKIRDGVVPSRLR